MNNRGSVTVESCLVMTITLYSVFMVIFTAMYMYDYFRVYSFCHGCAWEEKGKLDFYHDDDGLIDWQEWKGETLLAVTDYDDIKQTVALQLAENCPVLYFGNTCDFDVSAKDGQIIIDFTGEYRFPVSLGMFANGGVLFEGSVNTQAMDTVRWIRLIKGIVSGI